MGQGIIRSRVTKGADRQNGKRQAPGFWQKTKRLKMDKEKERKVSR